MSRRKSAISRGLVAKVGSVALGLRWYFRGADLSVNEFRRPIRIPTTNSSLSTTTTTQPPIDVFSPSNFPSLHTTTRHFTHGILLYNRNAAKRYRNHHIWKCTAHKRRPRCCSSWPSARCRYVKVLQSINTLNLIDDM